MGLRNSCVHTFTYFFRPTEVEQDNQDGQGGVSCPLEDREMSACSPGGCVMVEQTSEP